MEDILNNLSPSQIQLLSQKYGRSERQILKVISKPVKLDLTKVFEGWEKPKGKSKLRKNKK